MEAVPRMPMLSFELKQSPEFVEFGPTLKQYIRDHYGEDPALYNKSCNELEQLRQSAVHVSHDFMGCSVLKKYYAQLQFLQGRFPMTELGEAAMPFTWEDMHSAREITHNDIKYEQACILYNIGSLHSLLGALDTRQSADGMKVSCTHFQCAAWAYEHLRDHYGSSGMSLDMSHELLTFQSNLMLAQAQECILEKSMADSRKSSITAKVSAQIVEFYNAALKSLTVCNTEELISSKQYKEWKKKIDMKVLFYTCITNYYMGQQSQEQQKWGQCLAYYTLALNKLEECEKLAKNETSDVQEALRFTHDVVGGKHQAAKKDNDFVYHEKVPDLESLPEVKGAPLVKGIPFNANDPEISGPDIFIKLVPMSAHEASSLYSEEKANLLRRIASEIAEKDDELNQYLSSLQLDQTELNPEPERLPQQLLEKCAALSVRPNAIKDLVDSMTAVSNVAIEVDLGIKEIQQMLQDESKAELEYQELFGKRAPSIILSEIAKECAKFEEGHKKGSQSNTDLHKAMNTHINNLKLLSSPLEDIQKLLPSVDKERGPESADIIKELNMLMSKVEEMRTQRQTLEQSLRKEILEDDITGTLAKQEGVNRETVFAEQLKKHEKNCTLIRQNLAAQGNILRALTDANAKYANVRRATRDTIVRRDQVIRDLINSYDIYEDLMGKSQKGLEFYKKLEANVQKLLSRCRGVCKVQQEEREQMMNRYKPKTQVPARPVADKPTVTSGSGYESVLPSVSAVSMPSVTPMFDGPKLKDYLPFMKPNTFGKKAGSPDISKADPAVQNYISKTGSLPNSGTASPVHLPNMSGSVPASPEHFRQSKFNPQLQGVNEGYLSLQDVQDITAQGQGQPQPLGQGQPGQGLPSHHRIPGDPRIGSPSPRGHSQSPSPRPQMQYSFGYPEGQDMQQNMGMTTGTGDQYVPLNEKWKRETQIKGRGTGVAFPSQGQGQIPNQLGQDYSRGMPQGHAGSQIQPQPQPHVPASQGVYLDTHIDQSQTLHNQQVHQPGVQAPVVNPHVSHYQPNMQYSVPNQQTMIYGPQSMVGYREVTNTVSTVETPVISPNKDGQAQVDQYGQVIGGHRHLKGTTQNTMNQSRHAVAQQPTSAYANEQYWQQQMQQQRERLGQSQIGPQQQIPAVTPGGLPSQSIQSGPNVQGQVHSVQGQVQSAQSQGQVSQGHVQSFQGQGQSVQGQGQSVQGQSFTVSGQGPAVAGQSMNTQHPNTPGQVQYPTSQGMQGFTQPQHGQYQGQTLTSQGQQFQGILQQNLPASSYQSGYNQQTLQVQSQIAQPQYGTQQIPSSQQHQPHGQVVPGPQQSGKSTPIQSQQAIHQMSPFSQQMQPQTMQQVPYSQPGVQSSTIQQPGPQTRQAGDMPNIQQQFPQQPGVGQYQSLGSKQIQHAQPQQPVQSVQIQQNILDTQQMQQQNLSQQFPQNQQYQQPTYVQPYSNFQSQQAGQNTQKQQLPQSQPIVPQHQQGPLDPGQASAVQQRPGQSGSPHPAHFAATPVMHQQPNMTQTGHQSNQFQQGTQNFSPQHVAQRSQNPVQGVDINRTGTPQPGHTQQSGYMTGQAATSQPSQQFQQYQQPSIQHHPQQQGHQAQVQTGQTYLQGGQSGTSQGQSLNMTSQIQGQISTSQPVQPLPQQQGQSVQAAQFRQGYPPQFQTPQGQGQNGQRYTAPQQPNYPPSSSGSPSFVSGQRFSTPTSVSNQRLSTPTSGQGQIYPVHSQGNTVQGQMMMNQGQQQQFQGNVSVSTPSIPVPGYSETAVNRQATVQMFQNQQNYPTQGQQQSATMVQGQTFQGQLSRNYGQGQSTVPGQQVQSINNVHQNNGPTSGIGAGPLSGQGQGQGQSVPQLPHSVQFPGQQPPLQPQILQPTAVQKPKNQDQVQGHFQGESQGQSNFTPPEKQVNTTAGQLQLHPKSMQNTVLQTSTTFSKPFDLSQDIQPGQDTVQSEGQSIPASRQLSTASSLDEILSSSPDTRDRPDSVLAPKVLTAQEIQQQKEDQMKNSNIGVQSKDPYKDRTKLDKFVTEVEKLAKFIEGYEKPSCSGPTPLDSVFKELMEEQEKAGRKQTLAIARCYPMKNRDQDIMPFDDSRVLISSLKDDYINASWINDLSPSCPKFIATQWPLPVTLVDFWLSIYEQGVEVIAALSSEIETGKKYPVYVPETKGETISHGPVQLTLQSVKQKPFWTERIIHLRHSETKSGRTLVHLHYSTWPVSGFPEKVSYLLQFITEVHSFYRQQRSLLKPIVVHCSNGVGRTGIFLLIYMGMMEVNHGQGIINIPEVAGKMLWKRRNLIHKKDQLKYCYNALLYYAQDVLAKQGILIHKASFGDQLPKPGVKSQSWEPGEDILFGSMSFSNLQTNIAKLGTKTDTKRLDQRLEMLKSGEKEEKIENQPVSEKKSASGTILPDLVQSSPGKTIETKLPESTLSDVGLKNEESSDPMDELFDDFETKLEIIDTSTPVINTDSKEKTNRISFVDDKGKSSPAHTSRDSSASPKVTKKFDESVSSSLSQLQDPSTFTIGTGESNKKKKITKADFTGERKKDEAVDPNDPLSSLDPFWTVKK